jgi:hypothetical protein
MTTYPMSIYSQILKTLVIRPHFLYLSEQADRESFVIAVIEHNKISLESYKKIQIMKLTVTTN